MRIAVTCALGLMAAGCAVGPHAMVGHEAPQATLPALDDVQVDLVADDAQASIFYFWASWCGPCRMMTPLVTDLASAYKDKGVRLVAINVGEDPDTVRAYAGDKGLEPHAVMDINGSVSTQYDVSSLPTVMIVDGSGVVQAVYEGYSSSLRNELDADIAKVLAGTSLVPAGSP